MPTPSPLLSWLAGHVCFTLVLTVMIAAAEPPPQAEPVPRDLRIEAVTGGLEPWEQNTSVLIGPGGSSLYTRFRPGDIGAEPLAESAFTLDEAQLASLWRTLLHCEFFTLDAESVEPNIRGGSFATLEVCAGGRRHRVNVENRPSERLAAILRAINERTPPGMDLVFELGPAEPCQDPQDAASPAVAPVVEPTPGPEGQP